MKTVLSCIISYSKEREIENSIHVNNNNLYFQISVLTNTKLAYYFNFSYIKLEIQFKK
jgi:hypothetical protein